MRVVAGLLLLVGSSLAQSVTRFSLTEVSQQFDQIGILKSESRFFFAVNRDGSMVSVDLDPSAGVSVEKSTGTSREWQWSGLG